MCSEDIPWLRERAAVEWAEVDFGWLWGEALTEWYAPGVIALMWCADDGHVLNTHDAIMPPSSGECAAAGACASGRTSAPYIHSMAMATALPPPRHNVASPVFLPRSFSA